METEARVTDTLRAHVEPVDADLRRLVPGEMFREVIGHFASGVTVVTVLHGGETFGTTSNAVSSLSLEPPMLLVCMNKESATRQAIAARRCFAVNVLADDQADLAVRFAKKGGDKFSGVQATAGLWGEPLLEGSLAIIECRVVEEVTGGTHSVFLSEVHRARALRGAPLAYFRGQFGRLELRHGEGGFAELLDCVYTGDRGGPATGARPLKRAVGRSAG